MGRVLGVRAVERDRDREPAGHEAERRVEADVVHGARHGLEADRRRPRALQTRDPGPYDLLPHAAGLALRPNGQRTHPSFAARAVHDVEGHDLAPLVAPQERAGARILDRVAPDERIEVGHAHAHHAVAPIPLGEAVAEDLVEGGDVLHARPLRAVGMVPRSPRPRDGHQPAAPAAASSGALRSSPSIAGRSSRLTTEAPVDASYRTVTTWSSMSRTDSTCVMRITCSNRSCSPRRSSRTLARCASSSDPKISSSTRSENGCPERSAIICEIARRSTRLARSSSPPDITGLGMASSRTTTL